MVLNGTEKEIVNVIFLSAFNRLHERAKENKILWKDKINSFYHFTHNTHGCVWCWLYLTKHFNGYLLKKSDFIEQNFYKYIQTDNYFIVATWESKTVVFSMCAFYRTPPIYFLDITSGIRIIARAQCNGGNWKLILYEIGEANF